MSEGMSNGCWIEIDPEQPRCEKKSGNELGYRWVLNFDIPELKPAQVLHIFFGGNWSVNGIFHSRSMTGS